MTGATGRHEAATSGARDERRRSATGKHEAATSGARDERRRSATGKHEAATSGARDERRRSATGKYDHDAVAKAVHDLLVAVGEDPERDGLQDTPERVARAYREIFAGLWLEPEDVLTTTFDMGHDEMVLVKDIEVRSMCEHHLVPFTGVAHVGYIPAVDGRITGLSKLARLVDVFARRPQVQERLTTQVADSLMRILEPRGAIVVIECEHLCMSMRGVRRPGARTVTSAVRGQLRDPTTRAEAMSLIVAR